MEKVIKIALAILCVPLLILGFSTMFDPTGEAEKFGVLPDGVNGLNTIRGVIGGLLVGTATMLIAGLIRKNTTWLLAAGALMAVALLGRFVGVALDGFVPELIGPIVIEIIILALVILADKKFSNA